MNGYPLLNPVKGLAFQGNQKKEEERDELRLSKWPVVVDDKNNSHANG
jgi:hypothetical protein